VLQLARGAAPALDQQARRPAHRARDVHDAGARSRQRGPAPGTTPRSWRQNALDDCVDPGDARGL
jgi:hypothetical protein